MASGPCYPSKIPRFKRHVAGMSCVSSSNKHSSLISFGTYQTVTPLPRTSRVTILMNTISPCTMHTFIAYIVARSFIAMPLPAWPDRTVPCLATSRQTSPGPMSGARGCRTLPYALPARRAEPRSLVPHGCPAVPYQTRHRRAVPMSCHAAPCQCTFSHAVPYPKSPELGAGEGIRTLSVTLEG